MSLVTCKECKKQVSSLAPICPHCGVQYPGSDKPLIAKSAPEGGFICPYCDAQDYAPVSSSLTYNRKCRICGNIFITSHLASLP